MNAPEIKTSLPGPKARAIIERDANFVSPSYTRDYPLVIARGEGAVIEDVDGNVFLDCAAGIAVNSTGISHPEVVNAIADQAAKFIHMSGTDFYYEPQVRLAEELAKIVPVAAHAAGPNEGPSAGPTAGPTAGPNPGNIRSFFGNSGTEATEASLKLARYATKRPNIIGFFGSFHGRSLGALALTSSKIIQRRGFGPMMPGVYHAPYPDPYRFNGSPDACAEASLSFIREQIFINLTGPDEVAAVVVEPIQGEGGYITPPKAFLQGLRELTGQHGILLVLDEVQSGMGRTGRMFAAEHFGVRGDIVNIAKGIASGLPLGVTCARKDVMTWPPGAHASTFGGNPVACAAALTTIRLIRERYVQNAAHVGEHLMNALRALGDKYPIIGDVRGMGLMIGVEFVRDRRTKERAPEERNAVIQAMFRRGVLVLGAGRNAVRFAPPLVLTIEQANTAVRVFDEALAEVTHTHAVAGAASKGTAS
jgi:4-aminobutyrate aminotransferase